MAYKDGYVIGTVMLNPTGSDDTLIGSPSNTGTVTIGNSSSDLIQIDCGAAGINVGTTANAHATKIGSTHAASTTTIQAPSAGVKLLGVQGVAVANKNYVTINTSTGAIGSDAGPSSGFTSVVIQTFTGDGTYTPTAGMKYCVVEVVGGGGGGASAVDTSMTTGSASGGGGGGAGGYAREVFSAATIGASKSVTVGAAGAAGSASDGGTGGTSDLGGLVQATGGVGGSRTESSPNGYLSTAMGGLAGVGSGGNVNNYSQSGGAAFSAAITVGAVQIPQYGISGQGGSSMYGSGGRSAISDPNGASTPTGNAGLGYGSGGSGGTGDGITFADGGAGTAGIVIVTEYI